MSESDAPVFHSPADDTEMDRAAAKARQTFRFFWREMAWERRRIVPALELAAIKASFSDPPEIRDSNSGDLETEHMWLSDVDFDGRRIRGTLLNSPQSLKSVKEGDRVSLGGKQLCDWMYVIAGTVYGGFTVDLMRCRMSKAERKQHDQAWGLNFGEAGVVHVVPPEYLGDAEAKRKGLLSRWGSSKPQPQDYRKAAATEHPMSVNMRDSLEEAISENPELVRETDDLGQTFLHQLALAGSFDGVDVCLRHGAEPSLPAKNGMTPLGLAKCLGWKRVADRIEQAGGS